MTAGSHRATDNSFNPCRVFSGLATVPRSVRWRMPEFQSLSGFFRPCNSVGGRRQDLDQSRFNPCRVFSGLATWPRWGPPAYRADRFNPCRVFSGLATESKSSVMTPVGWVSIPVGFFQALQRSGISGTDRRTVPFQSLSGFFRPCNLLLIGSRYTRPVKFQSLSGFFRPCN